jgi:hypothetical protein
MWLWHAENSCRQTEDVILQRGFDVSSNPGCIVSPDDHEYYGKGIYLAWDSRISNLYARSADLLSDRA